MSKPVSKITSELKGQLDARKSLNEKDPVLNEVKGLLENSPREGNMLALMSPNSLAARAQREAAAINEIRVKESLAGVEVYTLDQVIAMGVKYNLKLDRAANFTSYIHPDVVKNIVSLEANLRESKYIELAKKRGKTLEEYKAENPTITVFDERELRNKFYILAPAKYFDREADVVEESSNGEPVMFYWDREHMYLVKEWGKGLSNTRRLLGMVYQNELSYKFFTHFLPLMAVILILTNLVSLWFLTATVIALVISAVGFSKTSPPVGKARVVDKRAMLNTYDY